MDMDQPGVEVRPLVQITGEAEFNELFIEEARIPHENVVGEVDQGWPVAITTLMHERAGPRDGAPGRAADRAGRADRRDQGHAAGGRPARARPPRAALHRGPGAAAERLPRHHRPDEARLPRSRGLARQVALGRDQPGADAARARPARAARDRRRLRVGATATCGPAATRSRAGRPRSSRTSSPSESWDCQEHELRSLRRPEGHPAHRAGVPGRALQAGGGAPARARGRARLHRRAVARDHRARLARPGAARGGRRRRARDGRAGRRGRGARLRAGADAAAGLVGRRVPARRGRRDRVAAEDRRRVRARRRRGRGARRELLPRPAGGRRRRLPARPADRRAGRRLAWSRSRRWTRRGARPR